MKNVLVKKILQQRKIMMEQLCSRELRYEPRHGHGRGKIFWGWCPWRYGNGRASWLKCILWSNMIESSLRNKASAAIFGRQFRHNSVLPIPAERRSGLLICTWHWGNTLSLTQHNMTKNDPNKPCFLSRTLLFVIFLIIILFLFFLFLLEDRTNY